MGVEGIVVAAEETARAVKEIARAVKEAEERQSKRLNSIDRKKMEADAMVKAKDDAVEQLISVGYTKEEALELIKGI